MPQIVVTIDGKTYRMACSEGEEDHLLGLAARLDARIGELRGSFGEIGDQRLTVMAAITTMDEVAEAQNRVQELETELAQARSENSSARNGRDVLIQTMNGVSDAIERVALKLERLEDRD
ncbi:cell division protein ZapA [Aureimonas fodinaquatilis]|uniref:Cell division protein ZapA n=1 Tax=Aureimonas fodinaquatilis TaxID=2565783 RepID=A0A5B0DZH2_9HYPH|nr:cell division protein ZapA [Aureimonas fodinaquatilis]KAA0971151.1 cell division protein ZapA [Aureimonas fodinaquatilis]